MFNPQLCNTSTWSKVLVDNLSEIDKNVYLNRKRAVINLKLMNII
ncbi:hypothetical protein GCM10008908_03610 [Clostridium subterminale]|uniref:Uncharacterized protein n=1 Tax=Clostridium subterminale TaxID=1550 RepID=A0ABP3VRV4_CLOSU